MSNPYASAARTLAISFEARSCKDRMAWMFQRVRLMERIDGDLRRELQSFALGTTPAKQTLVALGRMRRAIDQLQEEVEAIEAARNSR